MSCTVRAAGWHNDPAALREEKEAHGTFSAIALIHGGHASTYSKAWQAAGFQPMRPGPVVAEPADIGGTVIDVATLGDIDAALRDRGLNPDEWVVVRVVVNNWDSVKDGEPVPLRQLKVTVRPKLDTLIRPAVSVGKAPMPPKPDKTRPRLVVFVGDEQAPYHDETLHRAFRGWLARNLPDEGIHLGDLMDFPTLSRHRANPVWNASPQECVDAGYRILKGYRDASPDTFWTALPGNHEERIRDYQLGRAAELYGVTVAEAELELGADVHSPRQLLRLDELGIAWVGAQGDYEHNQVDVSPELVARHGFVTGANSAQRTVEKIGLSVVVGHTHRQVITYVTEERRRESLTMMCIEAGCMCRVEGGLGYVVNPNWQQGFATAQVWPDGRFTIEHGVFRDGVLRWRDQCFS